MAKAFPTAYGFGTGSGGTEENIGGRGGAVLFIDNLNDSGAGSARAAFEASGPRMIIPRVAGIVALSSNLFIDQDYCTYAGQVAPGDGLIFKNYSVGVKDAHDVIIRHLRSYPGHGGPSGTTVVNPLIVWGSSALPCYNITVDHCTALWGNDEMLTAFGLFYDVTFQYCLSAEAAVTFNDTSAATGLGALIDRSLSYVGKPKSTMSMHHCAFITNENRNPLLITKLTDTVTTDAMRVDMRNCLSYNWNNNGYTTISAGFYNQSSHDAWVTANSATTTIVEANVVKCQNIKGSSASSDDQFAWVYNKTKTFFEGNLGPAAPSTPADGFAVEVGLLGRLWDGGPQTISFHGTYSTTNYDSGVPFTAPSIVETPVADLFAELTVECGATLPAKDNTWTRIMDYTIADTGPAHADFDVTEGYPTLASGTVPTDTSQDGMPDTWKTSKGLNTATDDSLTFAPSGYTWLEEYVNETAGDPVQSGSNVSMTLAETLAVVENYAMVIDAPINSVPGAQTIVTGVQTAITPDIEVLTALGNLSSVRLTVSHGTLIASGPATIS